MAGEDFFGKLEDFVKEEIFEPVGDLISSLFGWGR